MYLPSCNRIVGVYESGDVINEAASWLMIIDSLEQSAPRSGRELSFFGDFAQFLCIS